MFGLAGLGRAFNKTFMRLTLWAVCLSLSGMLGYAGFALCYREDFDASFATLLMDSGHWREAAQMLEARQSNARWDTNSTILLARASAGLGDIRRCAEVLESVPDSSPLKPDALLREGQAFMQLHDAVLAESAWRRCVEHPRATRETLLVAWGELASLYGTEDRQEELRTVLWSLYPIVAENKKPRVLQQLLDLSLVREEPTVRATKLEEFIAANEQDVRAKVALGLAYLEANKLERGLEILKTCLEQAPSDVGAWRGWLRAVYQQGDLDKLAAELDLAPEGMGQLSGFWKLRAIVAQDRRDWVRAADSLAKSIELSPFEADLHSQYAVVLARLNQQELAEEHGRKAKQLRSAQADLRVAYEDWLQKSASDKASDSFGEIARRIASAYRLMGLEKEAEVWDESMNTR